MDDRTWIWLKTLAEELNVTKAAEVLHCSQPALSKFFKKREEALGVKLFLRRPGGLVLTRAGAKYLEYQEKAHLLEVELQAEFDRLKRFAPLRLGITPWIGSFITSRIIEEWGREQGTDLEIVEEPGGLLIQKFFNREVDFLISIASPKLEREGTVVNNLLRDELFLAVPHCLLPPSLREEGELTAEVCRALRGKTVLTGKTNQLISPLTERVVARYGLEPSKCMRSQNMNTLLKLIDAGQGYSCLPSLYIRNGIRIGRCCFFRLDRNSFCYERNLYWERRHLSPRETRLVELIGQVCIRWAGEAVDRPDSTE